MLDRSDAERRGVRGLSVRKRRKSHKENTRSKYHLKVESPYPIPFGHGEHNKDLYIMTSDYLRNIDALYQASFLPGMISLFENEEIQKLKNRLNSNGAIPKHDVEAQNQLLRKVNSPVLLARGLLLALCSLQEDYLANILRFCFNVGKLDHLLMDERIPFATALDSRKVELLKEELIDKRIMELTLKSARDQLSHLCAQLKLPYKPHEGLYLEKYVEVFLRRNQIAHAGGLVTGSYRAKLNEEGMGCDREIGDVLTVTGDYLRSAADTFQIVSIALFSFILAKSSDESENSLAAYVNDFSVEALRRDRFDVVKKITEYSCCAFGKTLDPENYLNLQINRAQAYKWSGDQATCDEIASTLLWPTDDLKYTLAHAALDSDFDKALKCIDRYKGSIALAELLENCNNWPIFREFREEDRLKKFFGGTQFEA